VENPNFRWNFTVKALDIAFFSVAMNIISFSTVLPLPVSRLTPSKVVIGLVQAIYTL